MAHVEHWRCQGDQKLRVAKRNPQRMLNTEDGAFVEQRSSGFVDRINAKDEKPPPGVGRGQVFAIWVSLMGIFSMAAR